MADSVGRSENLRDRIIQEVAHVTVSPAEKDELVRLVIGAQLNHLFGDHVRRLVPGNRDELGVLVTPFLGVGSLHRHLDPIRIIQLLQCQMWTRADRPVIRL